MAQAKASGHVSQTAREWGTSSKGLHEWIKQFSETEPVNVDEASPKELVAQLLRLEKRLAARDQQIKVLKKAIGIVSQDEPNGSS